MPLVSETILEGSLDVIIFGCRQRERHRGEVVLFASLVEVTCAALVLVRTIAVWRRTTSAIRRASPKTCATTWRHCWCSADLFDSFVEANCAVQVSST